jgi:hypothetical protein
MSVGGNREEIADPHNLIVYTANFILSQPLLALGALSALSGVAMILTGDIQPHRWNLLRVLFRWSQNWATKFSAGFFIMIFFISLSGAAWAIYKVLT